MPRTKKQMNTALFNILIEYAASLNEIILDSDKARYIAKRTDEDSALLSDASLESLLIGRRIRLVKISHEEQLYFCLFGIPSVEVSPTGMESINLTPALLTCAVLEAKISPIATGFGVKDAIEADFIGVQGYNGHALEKIVELFPPMLAFEGANNYEYQHDLQRVIGSFLARSLDNQQIDLEQNTVVSLIDFFEANSTYIPFGILARSLISITWEGLFLDLYRCIEQIYSCIKVSALREDWDSSRPVRQLAELLELHLAWRPKEDEAFGSILEKCDPSLIRQACALLNLPLEETAIESGVKVLRPRSDDKLAKSVAKKLYGIRNNLVHYRPVNEIINKSDQEWNATIRLMLALVHEAYEIFGPVFFEEKKVDASSELESEPHHL